MGRTVSLKFGVPLFQWLRQHWELMFVLLGMLLLYTWNISHIPNGYYNDEVSIAVNARDIANMGKDQFGVSFPLFFKAFGEYKNPLYIYTVAALFKILGPSLTLVRLTSVLYALGTMIWVYLIGNMLCKTKWGGIMASIFLALTPWYFDISRIGFEVASTNFFFFGALYCLLSWQNEYKNKGLLVTGSILMGLYLYSYTTARLLSFLWFFLFFLLNINIFWKEKKNLLYYIIPYGLIIIPFIIFYITTPLFNMHFRDISILNTATPISTFWKNIIAYLSPSFLFITGDSNLRHHLSYTGVGEFFWVTLPLIFIGIYYLFRYYSVKIGIIFLLGVLLFPLPGSLTTEGVPHALRAFHVVPFVAILCALGVWWGIRFLKRKVLVTIFVLGILIGMGIQTYLYYTNYFTTYPVLASYTSTAWQKEEVDINTFLAQYGDQYDNIYESTAGRNQLDIFHQWFLSPHIINKIHPLSDILSMDSYQKNLIIANGIQYDTLKTLQYAVIYTVRTPNNNTPLFFFLASSS